MHPAFASVLLFLASPALASTSLEGSITQESIVPAFMELETALTAPEGGKIDVDLRINSPGGQVGAGVLLMNQISKARRAGIHVTCTVDGEASSMAAILLQTCSLRLIKRGSYLLFHEPSTFVEQASLSELRTVVADLTSISHRLAITATQHMRISIEEYEARIAVSDWFLSPSEALALGAVDGVLP